MTIIFIEIVLFVTAPRDKTKKHCEECQLKYNKDDETIKIVII